MPGGNGGRLVGFDNDGGGQDGLVHNTCSCIKTLCLSRERTIMLSGKVRT